MIKSIVRNINQDIVRNLVVSDGGIAIPAPVAWFDSSNLASITDTAGLVSAWADTRANGVVGIQASDPAKPSTGIDTQNGMNVLTFSNSSQLTIALPVPFSNAALTVFAVVKPQSDGTKSFFDIFGAVAPTNAVIYKVSNTSPSTMLVSLNDNNGFQMQASGGTYNGWNVVGGNRDASATPSFLARINAIEVGPTNITSPVSITFENATIGLARNGPPFGSINGNIAEIRVYDQVLDLEQRDAVVLDLTTKWAVP